MGDAVFGPQRPCSVELDGDSILFGFDPASTTWRHAQTPAQRILARRPRWVIDDRTAAGLQAYDLVRGYDAPFDSAPPELFPRGPQGPFDTEPHPSRIVVLQVGVNDHARPGFDIEAFEDDYRGLIGFVHSLGHAAVVTGITPVSDKIFGPAALATMQAINAAIRRVAADTRTVHAHWDSMPFSVDRDTTDGIHPTQAASNRLADRLTVALERTFRLGA
ncbi:SGNH/GDSL hydrolase family protein [Acidovorax sp. SUPP1855]|uniref:SGNH/GDSL hydrolase family protein n=1 Tax=Acidovorax sp. SUPP1855 TaxID=431774 RepID=UPI0023DE66BD|nr:GDSL-type esterase/lipase family protein [Acidovorax sp. SUPP1855]GKS85655.1 SGNH/GDSL hydrolase family protein [Acidovorax sp. SUPP1855]